MTLKIQGEMYQNYNNINQVDGVFTVKDVYGESVSCIDSLGNLYVKKRLIQCRLGR